MDRHLTDADMTLFTQLRMTAFGKTVIDLANDPACDEWTFVGRRSSTPWIRRSRPGSNVGPRNYSRHPDRQTLMPA